MKNTIKLELPSLVSSLYVTEATVKVLLEQNNATLEDIVDIQKAVKEAVDNCFQHAYTHIDKIGTIFVTLTMEDLMFTAVIRDTGVGIQDVEQAMMPLFSTYDGMSGMGFTIMETFMDEVKVSSKPHKGTKVTMKRKIKVKK